MPAEHPPSKESEQSEALINFLTRHRGICMTETKIALKMAWLRACVLFLLISTAAAIPSATHERRQEDQTSVSIFSPENNPASSGGFVSLATLRLPVPLTL
jgi:hypothetical protein